MKRDFRRVLVLTEMMAAVLMVACGGGNGGSANGTARADQVASTGVRRTELATTTTTSTYGMDFATRCAQPGVVKCVGFDDPADFNTGTGGTNGAYGQNYGIIPPFG